MCTCIVNSSCRVSQQVELSRREQVLTAGTVERRSPCKHKRNLGMFLPQLVGQLYRQMPKFTIVQ